MTLHTIALPACGSEYVVSCGGGVTGGFNLFSRFTAIYDRNLPIIIIEDGVRWLFRMATKWQGLPV